MSAPLDELLSCAIRTGSAGSRVMVSGELDMCTTPQVEQRLAELQEAGCKRIVLDLEDVSFLDSTALHLLVRWTDASRADGFEFAVSPGSGRHRRLLELTGLAGRLRYATDPGPAPG